MIVTISNNPRLGHVQLALLAALKVAPMSQEKMSHKQKMAAIKLYFNGLICYWDSETGESGYQITDRGLKALER